MKVPTEAEMRIMRDNLELRGSGVYWKNRFNYAIDLAKPAGTKNELGYLQIRITADKGQRRWYAHRIAYYLYHGIWPTQILDHKDQDKQNNDPGNLRLATLSLNQQNTPARANNKTGIKGVKFCNRDKRFVAFISINNKKINKNFATLQEAIDCRKQLEKTYHPWSPSVA